MSGPRPESPAGLQSSSPFTDEEEMGSERLNPVGGPADLLTSCNILAVLYLTLTLENCDFGDIFSEIMLYRVFEGHFGST